MLVAYVSGHGFGHATRTGAVLRELRAMRPALPIEVRSSAPRSLFREALGDDFAHADVECDTGVAQLGPLAFDPAETLRRCDAFDAGFDGRAADEAEHLVRIGARAVLGDVPPLAFAAARRAGVPGVALANFSWDWIYRHLARAEPGLRDCARRAAAAYARADLLLRLPFAGDLSAFPRVEDVPLVARRPRLTRQVARDTLDLPPGVAVLWSFGGLGRAAFDARVLGALAEYQFFGTDLVGPLPANVRVLEYEALLDRGLSYPDLLAASDVVVTKPGYGIVSDAIGAGSRLVYTERGDFPEYPIMTREMRRYLACQHVSNADLAAGRLRPALESVLAQPRPAAPRIDGARVAAERISRLL